MQIEKEEGLQSAPRKGGSGHMHQKQQKDVAPVTGWGRRTVKWEGAGRARDGLVRITTWVRPALTLPDTFPGTPWRPWWGTRQIPCYRKWVLKVFGLQPFGSQCAFSGTLSWSGWLNKTIKSKDVSINQLYFSLKKKVRMPTSTWKDAPHH